MGDHPFEAIMIPASYQTPQGAVTDIQWVPNRKPTYATPAGALSATSTKGVRERLLGELRQNDHRQNVEENREEAEIRMPMRKTPLIYQTERASGQSSASSGHTNSSASASDQESWYTAPETMGYLDTPTQPAYNSYKYLHGLVEKDPSSPDSSLSFENHKEVEALIVKLQKIFSNREEYRELLSCDGRRAQKLLEMFQRLLDLLDSVPRPQICSDLIVAAQRLAGKSGLYPMCFELKDITTVGEFSVSSGAFADIYRGTLQGRAVCLKTIRLDQQTEIQHFLKICSREAILWAQLSHPNLLPFYGIYRFRNRLSLVSPWMEYGDITKYLQKKPVREPCFASDVAQGLNFLHNNGVIHGDLKGPNILVNELDRACLADFGLSSISDTQILAWTSQSAVGSKGGSVRWQAPELFDPEAEEDVQNTVYSDVYAWACIAYEIFTGQIPFSHVSRDTAVWIRVRSGERPSRPEESSPSWTAWGLTENIWTLMKDGWETDPKSRPNVEQIIARLDFEMRKRGDDIDEASRSNEQNDNALSPAHFRKMAGVGFDADDLSVKTLEMIMSVRELPDEA